MKPPLIIDVETSIKNKGNPFTKGNILCYVGCKFEDHPAIVFDTRNTSENIGPIQLNIECATHLVGFNLKFDLHWLDNYNVDITKSRLWDCQYAEYLFSNQKWTYPSLNETAEKYGLGNKLDIIKTEYWDKGISTEDIPEILIYDYLTQDLILTEQIFKKQQELFRTEHKSKWRLFQLHMEDLHCLREMEKNGILYDTDASLKAEADAELQIENIEMELRRGYEGIPINFDSNDHVSAYLYGGVISIDTRIPVGVYKSGAKTGQVRNKIVTHTYDLKRLVEPTKGSELKKEGLWSTDDKILRLLKGSKDAKRRIDLLKQRSKCEKLRGTYFKGFPKKISEMGWSNNIIHSTLNQSAVITGRLSSSKPNQQNLAPECKQLCVSRYADF
jgi:DNA polymerase I-like protein with 3'-5' exonuclease and polymerase domains